MNNKPQLTDRDEALLSALLDGELSPVEMRRIAGRLEREEAMVSLFNNRNEFRMLLFRDEAVLVAFNAAEDALLDE